MLPTCESYIDEQDQYEKALNWICRLYIEEVWAYLYPKPARRSAPVNEEFLRQVEESIINGENVRSFREQFAEFVKGYSRSGILYRWYDPRYAVMFQQYYEKYSTDNVRRGTLRLLSMRDIVSYTDEWVSTAAYHIWEAQGRPDGRQEEHWRQAFIQFLEAHP